MKTRLIGSYWKDIRINQPEKTSVFTWVDKFESELTKVSQDVPDKLLVGYYDKFMGYEQAQIEYTENTPIPYYFKLSPHRYYIENFTPKLWMNTDVDSTIRDKFIDANKYVPKKDIFQFTESFILFTLQSVNFRRDSLSQRTLLELVHWAESNKRYILFKLHPFTSEDNPTLIFWDKLVQASVVKKYAVLVGTDYNTDDLIQRADMVWTHSSGTSLSAVLAGKPVAAFSDKTDYAELYTTCQSPEEAANVQAKPQQEIDRFLSWYYHKLIIDVSRTDLYDQIHNRILKCIDTDYDLSKIFE